MPSPSWKFMLANSTDLSNIGELTQARGKQLALALNRPGQLTFNFPMSADMADLINPITTCVKAYRTGSDGATRLVWSGFVYPIDEDISGDRMTVTAVGWLQRLEKRILRRDKNYAYAAGVSTDDADIIFDLLADCNLTTAPDGYTVPVVSGSNPNNPTLIQAGAKLPNEGAGGATAYAAAYRGKSWTKYQQILSAIYEMTDVENGCDIFVTPDTRTLNIYRRRRRVLTNVVFGYNWGPNNIISMGRQIGPDKMVNYELATGRPSATPQFQHDTASQAVYGLWEEQTNLADVADTTILGYYANGEVVLRAQPVVTYALQPFPYTSGGRVPEPIVDYGIGDQISWTAKKPPRINIINQAARIFGMTFDVDEEGNEKLQPLQIYANAP